MSDGKAEKKIYFRLLAPLRVFSSGTSKSIRMTTGNTTAPNNPKQSDNRATVLQIMLVSPCLEQRQRLVQYIGARMKTLLHR
jgi:hypothetical protein